MKEILIKFYRITESEFMTAKGEVCTEARAMYAYYLDHEESRSYKYIANIFNTKPQNISYWITAAAKKRYMYDMFLNMFLNQK